MEGVTFGLTDGLAALKAAGSSVQRLSLVGGGSRSAMWAQQLASALNIEIVTHASSTVGGALGAARLGWLATGADPQAVCQAPSIEASFTPNPAEQDVLMPRYAQFRALYGR
jgi:xylulokinase